MSVRAGILINQMLLESERLCTATAEAKHENLRKLAGLIRQELPAAPKPRGRSAQMRAWKRANAEWLRAMKKWERDSSRGVADPTDPPRRPS